VTSAVSDGGARVTGRARRERATRRRVPWPLVPFALVAVAFLALPVAGLIRAVTWAQLPQLLTSPEALAALRLSLVCSTSAAVLCVVLGLPLAWVLAQGSGPLVALLRGLVTLPLVLPPVVGGLALLLTFGRRGLVGAPLQEWFGVSLPFTTAGVVVAETFVAMPFLVVTLEGAFRSADAGLEEAAATLGASRLVALRTVTLPLLLPSLGAGAVLAWARALGEFGATITFAGNLSGTTQTLPLLVYSQLESGDVPGAVALSLVLVAVALAVLVLLRDRWLRPGGSRAGTLDGAGGGVALGAPFERAAGP
jgi:molybdate transport system permease protein